MAPWFASAMLRHSGDISPSIFNKTLIISNLNVIEVQLAKNQLIVHTKSVDFVIE